MPAAKGKALSSQEKKFLVKVAKWCKSKGEPYCPITAVSKLSNWKKIRKKLEGYGLVQKHGGRKDTIEITDLGWWHLEEIRPEVTRRRRGGREIPLK